MHLAFLTPSPDPAGGGRTFNQGLLPALRAAGHSIEQLHGATALPEGATPIVDGLLLPDLERELDALVARDAVAIIHPVGSRAGRDAAMRDAVHATERRMLPAFRRVISTSAAVAERLASEFGVTASVLVPGLPELPRTVQAPAPPCRILCAGVLTPRKGHDRLLHALARLTDLDWHLTIAGDALRDPAHTASIRNLADSLGLANRLNFLPNPSEDALEAAWRGADLFALCTRWEGYPASVAEAMRRGIPVLVTRVDAVGALLPQAAGLIAPQDDPATLSKCLRRAIFDAGLRGSWADAAWQAGQALLGWPQQALAFETILRS